MATMLEHCQVHPSPGINDHELSLPLLQFDMAFLFVESTERLIFFDFPCSKSHFLAIVVPELKNSLAITLKHFLPLAGNVILPTNSGGPIIRYALGDSVSLAIAECKHDFDHLTGNNQRLADDFYACLPQLPPATRSPDSLVLPALALQVTLFPGQGICIGLTNSHAIADECSMVNFVKVWASVNRSGSDDHMIDAKLSPYFDRTTVEDPDGLDSRAWNLVKNYRDFISVELPPITFPVDRVRATFIMTKNEVQKLKNYVLANRPHVTHLSSFVVISAYIWTCLAKSTAAAAAAGEEVNQDVPESFAIGSNARTRLNPPLPATYFGNCLVFLGARSTHGLLKGDEGFLVAAESIGEAIRKALYGGKEILDGADWTADILKVPGIRMTAVAGSPYFNVYDADYGWGGPKKYEFVNINKGNVFSLCKSKEFEGGFEIGLSRKKIEMDAFESVFSQGLKVLPKFA